MDYTYRVEQCAGPATDYNIILVTFDEMEARTKLQELLGKAEGDAKHDICLTRQVGGDKETFGIWQDPNWIN